MRVLHLDSGREMRGGQRQVLSLVQGLGEGHVLLTVADGPLMREARLRGIDVEPMSILSLASESRRADVVHAHDARCHTWAASIGCSPLVVARRVAFAVRQSILSRWKYGRAHRYIAVSEHVRTALIEAGVPGEKIDLVYDGVPLPANISEGDAVLAPATADPMKGSDLVREAARLAGVRVDFSEDLERDLPHAGMFVYITRSEGLGSAALLAMAHGVPVIASRVGGLPEIVHEGVTGALTENEPMAIAEAIQRVRQRRKELSMHARRSVEERFTIDRMVQSTRAVYVSAGDLRCLKRYSQESSAC
jgi:hypothetical protein